MSCYYITYYKIKNATDQKKEKSIINAVICKNKKRIHIVRDLQQFGRIWQLVVKITARDMKWVSPKFSTFRRETEVTSNRAQEYFWLT